MPTVSSVIADYQALSPVDQKTVKGFIGSFRGVSTKYLNNYLVWHNFINYKGGSLPDKRDKVLTDVLSAIFSERNIDVKNREALPILA